MVDREAGKGPETETVGMDPREAELRASEERFRVAQESSLVPFTILRAIRDERGAIVDFTWTYANPAAARVIGRPVESLVGHRLLDVLPGNRPSGLFEAYVEVVDTGVAHDFELEYAADGIEGAFQNICTKLDDGVAIWFMDVTERKRTAERLALKRAKLEEASRQKDAFLATLSHELRNPLAAIRYAVALLRLDSTPQVLGKARDVLDRQSAHMTRMLDDLLDTSRITRGVIELQREPIVLRHVVEQALDAARPDFAARAHHVETDLSTEPLVVNGDATRLAQIVGNLLSNAAKYTPDGGHIHLSLERDDDDAVLRVRDDGIGIAKDMLPRVFELFAQVHPDLPASKSGLGIGLSLVERLVSLHGGHVEAASEGLGHGATFTVRLPLVGS